MTNNTRTFTDIDINFTKHPVSGDVVRRIDDAAIKQSIRNLVQTSNYDRPFHPEIGSQLRALLFEPVSPLTALQIQKAISQTIINYEPRVVLTNVSVKFSPDNNAVYATIEYRIVNTSTPLSVNLTLQRTR